MKLYHYTCSHAAGLIMRCGILKPSPQVQFPDKPTLLWLTDLDIPDREGLGLTSHTLMCDRTEHRFVVSIAADEAVTWTRYARRRRLSATYRAVVENCPGTLPMHWWVATAPLRLGAAV